jgi:hypothetical protein
MKTKSTVAVTCFLPGRAKDLSESLYDQKGENKQKLFWKIGVICSILLLAYVT